MEYILQFARILGFCLAGEALHHFLPLPVPASIYGLLLMFIALQTGWLKVERVRDAGVFLIAVFPVMFVPGTVGVMDLWDVLAGLWLPMILAVFPITALVFAVSGHVTQALSGASRTQTVNAGSQTDSPTAQTVNAGSQMDSPTAQTVNAGTRTDGPTVQTVNAGSQTDSPAVQMGNPEGGTRI